jgi:alanine racemase
MNTVMAEVTALYSPPTPIAVMNRKNRNPPVERQSFDLRPAMSLVTRVGEVRGPAAVIPVGVRSGLWGGSRPAQVHVGSRRHRVLGRVGLDRTLVAADGARAGEEVLVFGPGDRGEPTVLDWASWAGTIPNEVVTQVGNRVPRRFLS